MTLNVPNAILAEANATRSLRDRFSIPRAGLNGELALVLHFLDSETSAISQPMAINGRCEIRRREHRRVFKLAA